MLYFSQSEAVALYSEALKKAIEFRCCSVSKLAARVGVRCGSLHNYRNGYSYPSKRVHLALCEVLGFDLPYYGQGVRRIGRYKRVPK